MFHGIGSGHTSQYQEELQIINLANWFYSRFCWKIVPVRSHTANYAAYYVLDLAVCGLKYSFSVNKLNVSWYAVEWTLPKNWATVINLQQSPGLVVTGDVSCSRGRRFKSRRHILDEHFFTFICWKNCIVCLKRPKMNVKEARFGPFLKKRNHVPIETACLDFKRHRATSTFFV